MAEFNLNKIYQDAFGYQPPRPFELAKASPRKEFSSLGSPFYNEAIEDVFGREFFLPVYLDGYLLPFAVMSMTWKKTIVSTPMPERGGSVHEMISVDDYVFNIKGLLVDENNEFPELDIRDMHTIFKKNASIKLRSALSDIVLRGEADHSVIIKEMKWPPVAGVEHIRPFDIDLESDQIFELELK